MYTVGWTITETQDSGFGGLGLCKTSSSRLTRNTPQGRRPQLSLKNNVNTVMHAHYSQGAGPRYSGQWNPRFL